MSILGNVGNLYMKVLIILLVVGLGYAAYALFKYLYDLLGLKKDSSWFLKTDWLKLAVLSLTGIILLLILQNILSLDNRTLIAPFNTQTPTWNQNNSLQPNQSFNGWQTNPKLPSSGISSTMDAQMHASHHSSP